MNLRLWMGCPSIIEEILMIRILRTPVILIMRLGWTGVILTLRIGIAGFPRMTRRPSCLCCGGRHGRATLLAARLLGCVCIGDGYQLQCSVGLCRTRHRSVGWNCSTQGGGGFSDSQDFGLPRDSSDPSGDAVLPDSGEPNTCSQDILVAISDVRVRDDMFSLLNFSSPENSV